MVVKQAFHFTTTRVNRFHSTTVQLISVAQIAGNIEYNTNLFHDHFPSKKQASM
jgi:hypothetical protein